MHFDFIYFLLSCLLSLSKLTLKEFFSIQVKLIKEKRIDDAISMILMGKGYTSLHKMVTFCRKIIIGSG